MSEQGGRGDEGQSTPFILKRHEKGQQEGPRKKQKSYKSQGDPMVLMEGDLDEIGDKIRDTMNEVLQKFEQQHMQTLGRVQKDMRELQI